MSSSPVVCPQTHLQALRSLCPRAFGALLSARTYRLRLASPRAHVLEFLSTIHHAPVARWSVLLPVFVSRLSRAVRVVPRSIPGTTRAPTNRRTLCPPQDWPRK